MSMKEHFHCTRCRHTHDSSYDGYLCLMTIAIVCITVRCMTAATTANFVNIQKRWCNSHCQHTHEWCQRVGRQLLFDSHHSCVRWQPMPILKPSSQPHLLCFLCSQKNALFRGITQNSSALIKPVSLLLFNSWKIKNLSPTWYTFLNRPWASWNFNYIIFSICFWEQKI